MGNFARLIAASKAGFDQSPRLPNGEGKRGQGSSNPASRPALEGQARAPEGTIPEPIGSQMGRKPQPARFESQTRPSQKLYWSVVRHHGRRSPGRNIVTRGIRTHGRVRPPSKRELARSIRTFQRWLAPPIGPVRSSDYPPHGQTAAYQGGKWAIPTYIVMCESGGDYGAVNSSSGARGAYQLMPSTYYANGGDGSWSPADQDRVAARVYASQGAAPWVCG
jgi:hypothetical protein